MNEANLRHFTDMCNAVKTTNPVGPPTLLISPSTYEQHKEWVDKLDADVCIVQGTAKLRADDNIWIVPHDWQGRQAWEDGLYYA